MIIYETTQLFYLSLDREICTREQKRKEREREREREKEKEGLGETEGEYIYNLKCYQTFFRNFFDRLKSCNLCKKSCFEMQDPNQVIKGTKELERDEKTSA